MADRRVATSGWTSRAVQVIDSEQVVAVKPRPELAPFFALDCQARVCTRGSDRDQLREYNLPPVDYFPVESPVMLQRPVQQRPHLDPARWPEIAERAKRESLRHLAAEYGVSHETIRAIPDRVAGGGRTSIVA